ncbi:MAG: hypothetical protein ACRDRL_06920 [Sciscionella sp.]
MSGTINNPPYYSDCRWKTQNVSVHNNSFTFNPTSIGANCTQANTCGFQGLFSNYGTYPSRSPYQGTVIEDAITFGQNDHFLNNIYIGPWMFMVHDQGTVLTCTAWQTAPYNQDTGSCGTAPPPTTSPPPPPPPSPAGNSLDADTATLESGIGHWAGWYSETATRTIEQAHNGTGSLKIAVTAPYGWGAQLDNFPGFPSTAGSRTVSFWARAGSPGSVGTAATITVHWKDNTGTDLLVTTLASPALSTNWQQSTAPVTLPAGVAAAYAQITGNNAEGTSLYLDDFFIG